jgi:hypothetical protein
MQHGTAQCEVQTGPLCNLDQELKVRLARLKEPLPLRSCRDWLDFQSKVITHFSGEVSDGYLNMSANRLAFAETIQAIVAAHTQRMSM